MNFGQKLNKIMGRDGYIISIIIFLTVFILNSFIESNSGSTPFYINWGALVLIFFWGVLSGYIGNKSNSVIGGMVFAIIALPNLASGNILLFVSCLIGHLVGSLGLGEIIKAIDEDVGKKTHNIKLHYACGSNNLDEVRSLLAAAHDPNQTDKDGITPLMIAAQTGNISIMKLLLSVGANIMTVSNTGCSALATAIVANQEDAVRFLIEAGADITLKDISGHDLLFYAELVGNPKIIALIKMTRETNSNITETDPYALLGISADDSTDIMTKKYYQLIKLYHPDKVASMGPEIIALAEKKTMQINEAYEKVKKDNRIA